MIIIAQSGPAEYIASITLNELIDLHPDKSIHAWEIGSSIPLEGAIVARQTVTAFAESYDLYEIERHARNVLDSVALIRSLTTTAKS